MGIYLKQKKSKGKGGVCRIYGLCQSQDRVNKEEKHWNVLRIYDGVVVLRVCF